MILRAQKTKKKNVARKFSCSVTSQHASHGLAPILDVRRTAFSIFKYKQDGIGWHVLEGYIRYVVRTHTGNCHAISMGLCGGAGDFVASGRGFPHRWKSHPLIVVSGSRGFRY